MCLPWGSNYLSDKAALLNARGARFDSHPALGHIYFTSACATNGFEGHCRIDQNAYALAGYTPELMAATYATLIQLYLDAFPTTPITFEMHTIFGRIDLWEALWAVAEPSHRVGAAAWWCSERLSLRGNETVPVWQLTQEIAASTYAVCQPVSNFSNDPWRFTDLNLNPPLDYGTETSWDSVTPRNQRIRLESAQKSEPVLLIACPARAGSWRDDQSRLDLNHSLLSIEP